MTITVTDLFCGAGGSSLGAEAAGLELVMAANHWQTAIDVHQVHFPDAGHDCADISQADPRRYPRTDILLASPECTNHSQARGVSRQRQDPTLWDAPDPSAERSRATMWDVPRFAEQMRYAAVVVENVVEATKWVMWPAWWQAMELLGYRGQVLSHNSMHHGVPQSRDRIYVVWTRNGLIVDLEMEHQAWCSRCDLVGPVRQAWKNGRVVGRYRQQWIWACTTCGTTCEPATLGAETIIDWSLPTPRIGDRGVTPCPVCGRRPCKRHWKPLVQATRGRVLAGLQRYGWAPITTTGAGNTHERTPGNRAHGLDEPLPVQQTTATQALATPPGFVLTNDHANRARQVEEPLPTATTGNRHALVVPLRRNTHGHDVEDPLSTVCASGGHHALVMRMTGFTGSGSLGRFTTDTDQPLPTCVTTQRPALLMRNNVGGAEMVTQVEEPARGTLPTRDRFALVDPDQVVDDCGFRMLVPPEIALAMAFPRGYIPTELAQYVQVKLAGNAVCPPNMQWIAGRIAQALESAA
jgi:DNA (cytosine-5)-methyltransferase 1